MYDQENTWHVSIVNGTRDDEVTATSREEALDEGARLYRVKREDLEAHPVSECEEIGCIEECHDE